VCVTELQLVTLCYNILLAPSRYSADSVKGWFIFSVRKM